MHPIIQMTVAVALVIMAARMWPPLVYVLLVAFIALAVIKFMRRLKRIIRIKRSSPALQWLIQFIFSCGMWLAIAGIADQFFARQISATQIVLCFACAYLAITAILWSLQKIRH